MNSFQLIDFQFIFLKQIRYHLMEGEKPACSGHLVAHLPLKLHICFSEKGQHWFK